MKPTGRHILSWNSSKASRCKAGSIKTDRWKPKKLWDYKSDKPASFPVGFSLAQTASVFLPDSKTLAIAGVKITDDLPGRIVVWDLENNKPKSVIHEFTQQIQQIAISPDGKILASLSMAPSEREANIRLYDTRTNKPLANLIHVIDEDVMGMAFSPDGKTLISASSDEKVYTWNLSSVLPAKNTVLLKDAVVLMNFEKETFFQKNGKTFVRDLLRSA